MVPDDLVEENLLGLRGTAQVLGYEIDGPL